jgi:hypothetical protein
MTDLPEKPWRSFKLNSAFQYDYDGLIEGKRHAGIVYKQAQQHFKKLKSILDMKENEDGTFTITPEKAEIAFMILRGEITL